MKNIKAGSILSQARKLKILEIIPEVKFHEYFISALLEDVDRYYIVLFLQALKEIMPL